MVTAHRQMTAINLASFIGTSMTHGGTTLLDEPLSCGRHNRSTCRSDREETCAPSQRLKKSHWLRLVFIVWKTLDRSCGQAILRVRVSRTINTKIATTTDFYRENKPKESSCNRRD